MTERKKPTASGTATQRKAPGRPRNSGAVPRRREIGGAACLVLAFLAGLACFRIDAVVLRLIANSGKGLIGSGLFVLPFSLLASGIILLLHRNRPVRLRVWCAMLLSPVLGAIVHVLQGRHAYVWSWGMFVSLYNDGIALVSGGALSGFFAEGLIFLISRVGTAVLFFVAFFLCLFLSLNLSLTAIIRRIRERPRYPGPEPEYERGRASRQIEKKGGAQVAPDKSRGEKEEAMRAKENRGAQRKRSSKLNIDIALDPEKPPAGAAAETAAGLPFIPDKPEAAQASEPITPAAPVVKSKEELAKEQEQQRRISEEVAKEIEKEIITQPEYRYPPIELLAKPAPPFSGSEADLLLTEQRLEDDFINFNIAASVKGYVRGPVVTRYEVELEKGTKLGSLTRLADDIALTLGCSSVRIAPIPGQISRVGIEVPNKHVSSVALRSVIDSDKFKNNKSKLTFAVGEDISGEPIICDIAKLPHLLIAGTTGSGKSVCMNSIIVSLLYKARPEEVRMIMIDPKMIELGIYNGIPHLLIPVVTDPKKAAGALQWAITEMMKRYRLFSETNARDIESYNAAVGTQYPDREKLPHIVIVIDELSDLMIAAAKDVEEAICRVAQMARAAGMHLIIATQRPSADVITGLMKANIPSRIAFAVSSAMESRIILDSQGAERLVGKGDMLFAPLGEGKPIRVQGCFISSAEVEAVSEYVKSGATAEYNEEIISQIEKNAEKQTDKSAKDDGGDWSDEDDADELLPEAVEVILDTGQASVSMLQRRLKLGYSRAARLVDQMEQRGIVGPFEGSKPRALLITREQWQESGRSTQRFAAQMKMAEFESEEEEK
jgi:S-DNA-T family DNA segregation ATPase FtsK/SpoIIIE